MTYNVLSGTLSLYTTTSEMTYNVLSGSLYTTTSARSSFDLL